MHALQPSPQASEFDVILSVAAIWLTVLIVLGFVGYLPSESPTAPFPKHMFLGLTKLSAVLVPVVAAALAIGVLTILGNCMSPEHLAKVQNAWRTIQRELGSMLYHYGAFLAASTALGGGLPAIAGAASAFALGWLLRVRR